MKSDAIEKIEELVNAGADIEEIEGRKYSRSPLNLIKGDMPKTLRLYSLTSLVAFLTDYNGEKVCFLHVEEPSRVVLYRKELDDNNRRESLVCADVSEYCPSFNSGHGYDQEKMTVLLQTCFHQSENRDKVIDAISKIVVEDNAEIDDDGFSQTVAAKTGVAMTRRLTLENPTLLQPILTFPEISPIERPYILRVKHLKLSGLVITLHESESRSWATEVMASVKTYLQKDLPDFLIV